MEIAAELEVGAAVLLLLCRREGKMSCWICDAADCDCLSADGTEVYEGE